MTDATADNLVNSIAVMPQQEPDDFIVVPSTGKAPFALVGPGLDTNGIPFHTVEDAVVRGREIARNSGVSLWDATGTGTATLIASFRRS